LNHEAVESFLIMGGKSLIGKGSRERPLKGRKLMLVRLKLCVPAVAP
jgi:hypothetical protein